MNKKDIKKILGVLNKASGSKNFFLDYLNVKGMDLYCHDSLFGLPLMGLLLSTTKEGLCVNVPLSLKSYLNMRWFNDSHNRSVSTSQSLLSSVSNFFEIDVILGFIKDAQGDYYESYLLLSQKDRFLCVNVLVSEMFSMGKNTEIPIFLHKDVLEKRKINYNEIKKILKR